MPADLGMRRGSAAANAIPGRSTDQGYQQLSMTTPPTSGEMRPAGAEHGNGVATPSDGPAGGAALPGPSPPLGGARIDSKKRRRKRTRADAEHDEDPKPRALVTRPAVLGAAACLVLAAAGCGAAVAIVHRRHQAATMAGAAAEQAAAAAALCPALSDPPMLSTKDLSPEGKRCQELIETSPNWGEIELDASLAPGVTYHRIAIGEGPCRPWLRAGRERRGGAEWVMPPNVSQEPAADGTVSRAVFFHGGSFRFYSPRDHYRPLTSRIAVALGMPVLAVDYRLAPENRFPAAVEDGVSSLRWAVANHPPGFNATGATVRLAVLGDSAGGGLTLASVLASVGAGADRGEAFRVPPEAVPTVAGVFSPWIDMTASCPAYCSRAHTDILFGGPRPDCGRTASLRSAEVYLQGQPPYTPLASPSLAPPELLARLPATMMVVGDAEVLVGEVKMLSDRARQAGNDKVKWAAYPGMWHDWVCYAGDSCAPRCDYDKKPCEPRELPEGIDAIRRVASFVRNALGLPQTPESMWPFAPPPTEGAESRRPATQSRLSHPPGDELVHRPN
eukprot:TRINITY_DN4517_c0_g1_i1.p1 TRINITY_DN4517_c0_g1~~TRINITY_DN4517_c0_g1_i1.p1  ORF type:complete len:621 (+),score=114.05 TRINITY_DN4517_c0_g1_i1:186-1865(+)